MAAASSRIRCPSPFPAMIPASRVLRRSPTVAMVMRAATVKSMEGGDDQETTCNISTSVYSDNWLELLAINHLSKCLQAAAGVRIGKSGYDSLVDAARIVSRKFDPKQQKEIITDSLHRAIPSLILALMRALLPQSQFTREYFAAFTTIFFAWLIGPSEVRESELNGRKEKNVVYIRKCRFLEQSNCVGLCTNLCKMSSQEFIKDSLGMPVNMVPNFEDMSCQMIYGQDPPSPADDPAFTKPCYKLCNMKKRHDLTCST